MKLDETRIVVRYRSKSDVLDLAVKVLRVYAGPLTVALAAGVVPLFLLNLWLLADFRFYDFVWGLPINYMILTTLLVFLEVPLATAPATLLLGQTVFRQKPDARSIAREFRQSLPQLIVYQVLLRPITIFYPFLTEIILLERNPMRVAQGNGKSTWARNRELHRDESADLIINGFLNFCLGLVLFGTTWFSLAMLRTLFLGDWGLVTGAAIDRPMYTYYYQVLLWAIAGFTTVLRFLSYLNLGIRREGWDVELQLRAERSRLSQHLL